MGAVVYAYWGGNWREAWQALAAGCFGVLIGYLPNLLALVLVPGFAHAFWDSIVFLFEYGRTNLPLPIPWPWIVADRLASFPEALRDLLLGLFFMALPLFGVCGLIYARYLQRRSLSYEPSVFVAAALLAIPYTHYAYSRADWAHLALGIFPLLVGLLSLPLARERVRFTVAGLLLSASLLVTVPVRPGYQAAHEGNWRKISVGGDALTVNAQTAADIALVEQLASRYSCDGRTFVLTPYWPGAYALLHRKAPLWEIYATIPRSVSFQEAEIARIKATAPDFAVIFDLALDGREELRYARTHPLIERFIRDYFRPIEQEGTPAHLHLYARGNSAEKCP
jgi:hypothetical protein